MTVSLLFKLCIIAVVAVRFVGAAVFMCWWFLARMRLQPARDTTRAPLQQQQYLSVRGARARTVKNLRRYTTSSRKTNFEDFQPHEGPSSSMEQHFNGSSHSRAPVSTLLPSPEKPGSPIFEETAFRTLHHARQRWDDVPTTQRTPFAPPAQVIMRLANCAQFAS